MRRVAREGTIILLVYQSYHVIDEYQLRLDVQRFGLLRILVASLSVNTCKSLKLVV